MVMVFLKYMRNRDDNQSHFKLGGKHALDKAVDVGDLLGFNKTAVYNEYKEGKEGERFVADDDGPQRPGEFRHPTLGTYERRFLLNEEDLKIKFKKWMRLNLRQLTKKLAWEYLKTKLLKEVDEETLSPHNISLPISCSTALRWMKKCKSGRCNTNKTYYNDQHQKGDVIKSRVQYIETLERLQKRMHVWVVLLKVEQDNYLEVR